MNKTILKFTLKRDEDGTISVQSKYQLTEYEELVAIKETNRLLQELLAIEDESQNNGDVSTK